VKRRSAIGRAALVAAGVLALDQLTKAIVRATLDRSEDAELILGIDLTNVRNTGVAFGMLAGGGTLLTIVTLVALAGLAGFFVAYSHRAHAWTPTGLLLGGALGNLLDRIRQGYVTDFIDLPWWPAFNVADIAITFGVVALFFVMDRHE
jgi:signal peptidase II